MSTATKEFLLKLTCQREIMRGMKMLLRLACSLLIWTGILILPAMSQTSSGFGSFEIRKLAFETGPGSFASPHEDIFILDSLKSKPKRLATGTNAIWSPDGQRIAYCVHEGWGTPRIVPGQMQLINADGSGHKQLTNISGGACPTDWSRDGQKITFVGAVGHGVLVLGHDGESVASILPEISGVWSPDGSKLTFWKNQESRKSSGSIWVVNTDGTGLRKVIDDNSEVIELAWFPDGQNILFCSERNHKGKSEIFRVKLDGSELETFAADKKLSFFNPVISPDAKYLLVDAYAASGSGGSTIVIIDLVNHTGTPLVHGLHPHVIWDKP
jgi:Tol biopolymer transport system component